MTVDFGDGEERDVYAPDLVEWMRSVCPECNGDHTGH